MSGLALLLAGRTPAGTYRWHGGFDVADVRHTVEHAGWRFGYVDGLAAQTKPEFLARIGEALELPEWYGRNFDALQDCLTDVDGGEGTVLLWDGWGILAREEPRAFSVALSVLGTRVNADRGGRFAVLLRGEGPDVPGVPSLDCPPHSPKWQPHTTEVAVLHARGGSPACSRWQSVQEAARIATSALQECHFGTAGVPLRRIRRSGRWRPPRARAGRPRRRPGTPPAPTPPATVPPARR